MDPEKEKAFELEDLIAQLEKDGGYFLNFLKIRDLEAGIIVLHPGEEDTRGSHATDELYYVIEGKGFMEFGKNKRSVKKGSILFVPSKMHHRFYGNRENLVVLYMFAE